MSPSSAPDGAHQRIFVCIRVPEAIQQNLESIKSLVPASITHIRWTPPEQLHVTLRFMAALNTSQIQGVIEAAYSAGEQTQPFTVSIRGLGAFPSTQRPRVVWLGITQGSHALIRLHALLDARLARAGILPDRKEDFTPHLTVGRVASGRRPQELAELARDLARPSAASVFAEFRANALSVMRSSLERGGAKHEQLYAGSFLG